ncbi:hypothetical protein [Rubrimonas cliftonensis]|uniref:hypothetical protein n=1 Tax=Rubrimonas cliftonensis TaxID=89524 RepID=UPI001587EC32|nr:hypothetical protein [Rubrimonas cliftonensis]
MVAGDDCPSLGFVEGYARHSGHEVRGCRDAAQPLADAATWRRSAMFLLERHIQGTTALSLAGALRADPQRASARSALLSADLCFEPERKAPRPFDAVLRNPVRPDDLAVFLDWNDIAPGSRKPPGEPRRPPAGGRARPRGIVTMAAAARRRRGDGSHHADTKASSIGARWLSEIRPGRIFAGHPAPRSEP